ncbi:MAG: hypothetical protein ACK5P7_12655 [Bdellovibrio sp.]|jgi:hypothetical protein
MRNRKRALIASLAMIVFLSACSNVFEAASNKTSDEALYEDAVKLLDDGQYQASLAKFDLLSPEFATSTPVRQNWAGALAGHCGLNFVQYLDSLGEDLTGSPTFFEYLASAWDGLEVHPESCTLAEQKIKEIWTGSAPTASQQLFMAILSLAKMGTIVRNTSDNNESSGTGNGTIDAEFDACNDANPNDANQISDAQVAELVTGLSLFLQNITGFTAQLSGDVSNLKTALEAGCTLMTPNPCTTTEAANVSQAMIHSTRRILDYPVIGVGSCAQIDPNLCCPGL